MSNLLEAALAHAWPIQWFDEIDSTNMEGKRRALAGDMGPVWLAARQQTHGKGRLGRVWEAPRGNLSASVLFPFDAPFELISKLSFLSGLAVLDAIEELSISTKDIQLKWPNDLRLAGRKLSGILIESGQIKGGINWVVVGLGVNILEAPVTNQATICLKEVAPDINVNADILLNCLKMTFSKRLYSLLKFGFDPIRKDWMAHAEGLNSQISVVDGTMVRHGKMRGIDEAGLLLLELSSGELIKISTGDVETVR
ncbi:biotin--[acetyl-CoA-carboxylase] ligase [Hirschia litorea]|uniref:biotin--[biotin carboxyl-carrier protein] ligase n=1 Tax=Hirschia litorea TaxID=1199156 RepID=A0ABW2II32_9PROT